MISGISGGVDFSTIKQTMQERAQQRFAASDADSSGTLSLEEYQSFVPDFVEDIDGSFTQIDADNSGDLSEAELQTFAESHQGGRPPPPPGGNADGSSSSILELLISEAAEDSEDYFGSLDADGDGELSTEEVQAGVEQLKAAMMELLLGIQEESVAA
jgi:Ca2+-binding EF-hand superfamily protein